MTEHPEDQLAEYVDGALEPEDRARVDEHLAGCPRCRGEVALDAEARSTLRALPEVPAPAGLSLAVRRRARRPAGGSRAWRAAGIAAVAAAVVAGGFVVVTELAGRDRGGQAGLAGGGEPAAPAPEAGEGQAEEPQRAEKQANALAAPALVPTYSESNRNYDNASLSELGRRLRDRAGDAIRAGLPRTSLAFYEDFDTEAFTPRVQEAIRCVIRDVPPEQLVVPFTIEAARFEGSPAYVASFLQGPSPRTPYDRIVIWVVDRESCALRSLASQRL